MENKQVLFIKALMKKHASSMVQLTYRRTCDWQLSEDLVQETFLTACCKPDQVCNHAKPVAWLYDVLNKLTMRELDRAYRTAEVSVEEAYLTGHAEMDLPMVHYLPAGLNATEQELILMRVERGLSFAAIAEHYGISEVTCRQRVSRAMRKCRSLMDDDLAGQKN